MTFAFSFGEWPKDGQIYGFDLDDTLISGGALMSGRVETLGKIVKDGGRIAVFSNQLRFKPSTIERKFRILDGLGVPWRGWAATGRDKYRKPEIGMTEFLDTKLSIFVGDAAGRKGDHSDCDLQFAKAAGCPFQVPETFFACEYKVPEIDYKQVLEYTNIVLVGAPASGKSTVAAYLETRGYKVVSNDRGVVDGGSALTVIDNTHPSVSSRAACIKPGTLCIHMDTPLHICQGRNETRSGKGRVPGIVYKKYNKEFEMPTIKEGFAKVIIVK